MIQSRLHADGAIVTQSSSPFFARRVYWAIEATLRSAGFHTFSYKLTVPSFGVWGYHIAANSPVRFRDFNIDVPTQFLTNETLAAASIFGKDIDRIETPVNTLLEPNIYTLYVDDLSR